MTRVERRPVATTMLLTTAALLAACGAGSATRDAGGDGPAGDVVAGSGGNSGPGGATGSAGATGSGGASGGAGLGGTAGAAGSGGASGAAGSAGSGGVTGSGGAAPAWSAPENIGLDPQAFQNAGNYGACEAWAAVSVNDAGTAMVAYVSGGKVYVRRRAAHGSWMAAEGLETRGGSLAKLPHIGVVGDGTAWVTWQQTATTADFHSGIYESHFGGSQWETARQLLDDSGTGVPKIRWYRMAVNPVDGTGVLASNWANTKMHAMFRSGTTWTADKELATWTVDSVTADSMMDLAIDGGNQALLVWARTNGTTTFTRDLVAAIGKPLDASTPNVWKPPVKLNTDGLPADARPSVHLDRSGAGVVAWGVFDSTREIHVALMSPNGTFTAEETIDTTFRADFPAAVIDKDQNATVLWPHRTTSTAGSWNMSASRHLQGGGWQGADLESNASTTELRFGFPPAVAVNRSGKVTAVWVEEDDDTAGTTLLRRIIKTSRFDGSWSPIVRLDGTSTTAADFLPVVASSDSTTVALWWSGAIGSVYGATLQATVLE